jgi:hypothetical protein
MKRSRVLAAGMKGLFAVSLAAQPWVDFLKQPILSPEERRSMMYSYVDAHLPPIGLSSTIQEWKQKREPLRTEILRLVGLPQLDQRGPVKWVSKGRIERDSYIIEKILFESYPGMMVPGLVYVPKRLQSPAPAVISIPGHAYCEGKASESVQARCVNLASRGIIAMTFDYLGTGERNTGANACGGMPYGGANDHGLKAFSYTAGNPTGLDILDGIRAIDYLYTRPDVDRERLGFTGESGGSNSTYWVSALDKRVKLAVPVCSVTSFDYWIRNDRNWDWHQRPPGIRRVAEISTLLALIAPRPLLVIGALRGTDSEEFPFDQTEEAVNTARGVYKLYGASANIEIFESSTNHGYQRDKRERMYSFVDKHFFSRDGGPVPEVPFLLEPMNTLICGLSASNRTLTTIYSEWLERPAPVPEIPDGRREAESLQAKSRKELLGLLGIATASRPPKVSVQQATSRGDMLLRRLIIESEPGIHLPVVEITPGASRTGLIVLPGKSQAPQQAVEPLLAAGISVALVDLRGAGEIDSGGTRTDNWAWFVGRPKPGMWAFDIERVVEGLATEKPSLRIGILGTRDFARSALFATGLCPRIRAAAIELETPGYKAESESGGLADVPRILSQTDLPYVSGLAAPRPLLIKYPPEAEQAFRSAYAWSEQFYRRGFGADTFELLPAAESSTNEIAGWLIKKLADSP